MKQRKGDQKREEDVAIVYEMTSRDFTGKRYLGRNRKGESDVAFRRKSVPGRKGSMCKGPETGMCLAELQHSKDVSSD